MRTLLFQRCGEHWYVYVGFIFYSLCSSSNYLSIYSTLTSPTGHKYQQNDFILLQYKTTSTVAKILIIGSNSVNDTLWSWIIFEPFVLQPTIDNHGCSEIISCSVSYVSLPSAVLQSLHVFRDDGRLLLN